MVRSCTSWATTFFGATALAMTLMVGCPTAQASAAGSGSTAQNEPASPESRSAAPAQQARNAAAEQARERAATQQRASNAAAEQARERAATQQRARNAAAEQQARARARAQKRAAQLAAAAQRAAASWESRGRPNKLIVVRERSIDLVQDGRLLRQVPRAGGALTLATLDRFAPAGWLTIDNGTADVFATIVLTPLQRLTLGGDVHTVRLAGGPTPSDAASLYTGRGRLVLRGVTVGSFDPTTGQPLPAGPGRPFIAVSGGGRIEAVDSAINDLGNAPTDTVVRAGLALGETTTGSLVRTSLARNTIGLKLDHTDAVHLEGVTVSDSVTDGIVLRGDRGTTLTGIKTDGNGGNGVLVVGPSSERPISGISASGNKLFGIAMTGQIKSQVHGIATADNTVGGMRVSSSSEVAISDYVSTNDPMGVYTHVSSEQIVIDRAQITGARRGLQIEKTTRGVTMNASTIAGASITGVSIGGHQVALNQVTIADSATAIRVERGAGDIAADGLTMSGGQDGLVALSATKNVVLRNVVADGVSRTAIRTSSSDLQIIGGRITGSATGIDAGAATTITGATIGEVGEGIRTRSHALVDVDDAQVSALMVGINVAPGSPVTLTSSRIDALEAVRGNLNQQGSNELSLPPVNLLGAIGVPLVLLALALEQVQVFRQRGSGRGERRLPPPVPARTA